MGLDRRTASLIGGSLLVVAFVFFIVADAVPIWATSERSIGSVRVKGTQGLWKVCVSINGGSSSCTSFTCKGLTSSTCGKYQTGRAFVTIACILSGLTALCMLACAFITTDLAKNLSLLGKILAFVTVGVGIIGVAVGISAVSTGGDGALGVAAILGIIAVIINIAGAIVSIWIRN